MTDNQSIASTPSESAENADRRSTTQDDISLESMSAMIAAAIEMSSKGRGASSLSLGHASIIPSSSSTTTTTAQLNRSRSTSVRSFFTGSSRQSAPSQSKTKTTDNTEKTPGMTIRPKRSSSMSSQHSLPTPRRSSSASTHRYPARFSWLINPPSSSSSTTTTTPPETSKKINDAIVEEPRPSEEDIDDGKRELMYRGIRVKEIKTTLKTMVVPHEVERPMPNVKIERPSFARINY
ncbi:predicted protein [Lichtheimia corymbifera JMRC:FSU:9682]|uniref:Uncharacterized protein n=1 Tax=Lichtheimia corymbifera JMRC:FSU:9682 TaxID=1263082 RepID=A0A068RME0_9FUNG|nr:predicted protein [Lichtheimia corymbifera JMRC:FSU:9682]